MEEYQMNDILNKGIEDLEMSTRVMSSLGMQGIKTVGDITKMTESSLRRVPNIGRLSVNEIKHTLKDLGLELGMHSKPQEEPPEKTLVSDLNMDLILKVADTFKKYGPIDVRLINELMDIFEDMNPKFNREIFLNAVIKKDMQFKDILKENKILQSKVKTYEQDINNRPLNDMPTNINGRPFKGRL